ncbi:ATP-binding protein [Aciditerrimonas ferrireducens]|uniref:ATP-binding protein n=1 Tax=Aciditerrimonas ferrireducens TaxID=667306 RepID=UPI00200327BD|nr:ATP-binding protein [Aciditerrimonas ferrireducens]MCK4176852.1 ATP-binding protein [Aciditerrimonas ferrireducens]
MPAGRGSTTSTGPGNEGEGSGVPEALLGVADHWLWVGPRGAWRADPALTRWLRDEGLAASGGPLRALAAATVASADPLRRLPELRAGSTLGPCASTLRVPTTGTVHAWSWQALREATGGTWFVVQDLGPLRPTAAAGAADSAEEPGSAALEHLDTLLRLLPDVVALVGPDGQLRLISDAAYDWMGLSRATPLQAFRDSVDLDEQRQLAEWYQRLMAGEDPGPCRYRSRDRQGARLVLEMRGRRLPEPEDGAVLVIRDVTGPLTVEAELRAALAEARRTAAAQGELLERVAEELGPPLGRVLQEAEALAAGPVPPGQADSVGYVLRAARHLQDLLGELEEVARAERQTMEVRLAPVALRAVVEDAIQLTWPAAAQAGVVLESPGWDVDEEPWVRADRQRLLQVLLNLLANAVKYNRPGGRVTVDVEADPRRVRVAVSDTGLGIAPEDLPRLFDPFERLGAEHRGVPGTGVGLTVSRHLAEVMGGGITVRSELGVGSTFTLDLVRTEPVDPATRDRSGRRRDRAASGRPAADGPPERGIAARGPSEEPRAIRLPGQAQPVADEPIGAGPRRVLRILHVEDDLASAELVRRVLERHPGLDLRHAASGQAALAAAILERPDLVLLDLGLPDMPGWEVALRLERHPHTEAVPVVVVSADADHAARVAAACRNVVDRLPKPLVVDQLLAVVASVRPGDGGPTGALG